MNSRLIFTCFSRPSRLVFFVLGATSAAACGPDFPNCYLDRTEAELLAAPEGYFAVEIDRLAPAPHPHQAIKTKFDPAETAEGSALLAVLLGRGDSPFSAELDVRDYEDFRRQQMAWAADRKKPKPVAIPAQLPAEFSLYLTGAQAWYEGDMAAARKAWLAVLALPESQRLHRSTAAAYMLARTAASGGPSAEALSRFAEVRALAKAGLADPVNLAGASYGEEGRWALANEDYARALDCYLKQYATGDETAYASLRLAAKKAAGADASRLRQIAKNPQARRVFTVWFLARFAADSGAMKPEEVQHWTEALAAEKIAEVESADRLAWVAYEAGSFPLAKVWATLAPEAVPETHWIRGKLALREGDLTLGAKELQMAVDSPALSPIYRSMAGGELGRIFIALDRREEALRVWLDTRHWEDAAYVAEKVMTIDELKKFVAGYDGEKLPTFEPYWGEEVTINTLQDPSKCVPSASLDALRQLLARRLVRAGRFDEAPPFFNDENRRQYLVYVEAVGIGFNRALPARQRAEAFWRAARLVRTSGMELMGTELGPDFSIWAGEYETNRNEENRNELPPGLFAPTVEERKRLGASRDPQKRFSYRYRAAELAWWAASLLPNDDDETADILNTAGGWLKNRDPQAAKAFYQALVIRCGGTALGRAAEKKHWLQ